MLYEELQKSRTLIIALSIGIVAEAAAFIFILRGVPAGERIVPAAIIGAAGCLLILLLFWMNRLSISISRQEIRMGFGPLGVNIPVHEITAVRIIQLGFWKSGGIGIRWVGWNRWNYVAALGPAVEIQWGKKFRTFTTSNPDRIKEVLSQLLPGKVKDER